MGFYPGVVPYMTADGLSGAIKFASFEVSKAFLENKLPVKFHPGVQFLCAAGAMIACSVVMVPGEVIKTRMQAGMVKNMVEGITQTLKQDGVGGLFAGYYATLVRDVPYTMLELGFYENIKSAIRTFKNKKELSQSVMNSLASVFVAFFRALVRCSSTTRPSALSLISSLPRLHPPLLSLPRSPLRLPPPLSIALGRVHHCHVPFIVACRRSSLRRPSPAA